MTAAAVPAIIFEGQGMGHGMGMSVITIDLAMSYKILTSPQAYEWQHR